MLDTVKALCTVLLLATLCCSATSRVPQISLQMHKHDSTSFGLLDKSCADTPGTLLIQWLSVAARNLVKAMAKRTACSAKAFSSTSFAMSAHPNWPVAADDLLPRVSEASHARNSMSKPISAMAESLFVVAKILLRTTE